MCKYLFGGIYSSFEAYILFSVTILEAEMNLTYRKSFLATKKNLNMIAFNNIYVKLYVTAS